METVAWSRPEGDRAGKPLLLMLHGYGSDESRMSALFKDMPQGFVCAAPRASRKISGDWGWFLLDYFLANDFAEVMGAATKLLGWLDAQLLQHRFSSVSVLGFSQGMAMATMLIRLRPDLFTTGVGLSGFALHNELLATMEPLTTKIPFFWAYGDKDLVINAQAKEFTAGWLAANTELQQARYEDLGHTIRHDELGDVASFLTANVQGSFVPKA